MEIFKVSLLDEVKKTTEQGKKEKEEESRQRYLESKKIQDEEKERAAKNAELDISLIRFG